MADGKTTIDEKALKKRIEQEKTGKKEDEKKEAPTKKKAPEKKKEKLEERLMTIPLRDAWATKRNNRTRAAVKTLKRQIAKHTKKEPKLDKSLNQKIWARGDQKPPRKVKVRLAIGKETATAFPAE